MSIEEKLQQSSESIQTSGTAYLAQYHIDLNAEIQQIGKICQLGTLHYLQSAGTDIRSNYTAAALILLGTYPAEALPWILRNFPRPHGGAVWRAISDIDQPLNDASVNVLLDSDVITRYPGLATFIGKERGFLAKSQERTKRASKAWVALLLTQDNISEARNLYHHLLVNCSIRASVEVELRATDPEIAAAITG